MKKTDANCPPIETVISLMTYDEDTGVFTSVVRRGNRRSGSECGYKDKLGYVKISFNNRWVYAHRLAWRLKRGYWPENEIDHINGDPSDNRIENLRECNRSQNVMNTRRGNGVCWHKHNQKWQVTVTAAGKKHYIGQFDDYDFAQMQARKAKEALHGPFANIA